MIPRLPLPTACRRRRRYVNGTFANCFACVNWKLSYAGHKLAVGWSQFGRGLVVNLLLFGRGFGANWSLFCKNFLTDRRSRASGWIFDFDRAQFWRVMRHDFEPFWTRKGAARHPRVNP
jgi:hypothetical protein